MASVLHLLPHPGGGGERQHRLIQSGLPKYRHEFAAAAGRPELPWALPGLLFRRPFLAARVKRCDLVHIDGDTTAIVSTNVVGGRPYVLTTAGLHLLRRSTGRRLELVSSRLRERVHRSRATMCTSEAEFAELAGLCGDQAPLMVVRNGVPTRPLPTEDERRAAREQLGIPGETVVVLMLNRLEARKRPLEAARAAIAAHAHGAPLQLLVAGDGPLERQLRHLAGPAVRPLGFRRDTDLLLAAADLFLLASDWEGLSLGLLEAMAAGLPAIVSDGPGNPEVVDVNSGAVVPVGDEEAMASALHEFATSRERRARAGRAARRRVENHFSLDQMLRGVESAYQRALP